jgi:hypothetical protein
MITNERQYKISRAAAAKLEKALRVAENRAPSAGVDPRIHQAMQDGIRSQLEDVAAELREYDELRQGHIRGRTFNSVEGC